MTNARVVGDANRVRIVSTGKEEKMIAEILRIERKRDVALLRLEKIPDDLRIKTLPIRSAMPAVGEDVYAIGAPNYKRLQDTVTKGIISAHRIDPRRKHPIIQADVTIHGGNSGGPLLDKNGNLIGLAVSQFVRGDIALDGLNNFIPLCRLRDHDRDDGHSKNHRLYGRDHDRDYVFDARCPSYNRRSMHRLCPWAGCLMSIIFS